MCRKILTENENIMLAQNFPETRGSRPKFWFHFFGDEEKWLFKKTNWADDSSFVSYEDVGEVVFENICKQINIPCAEYKLAKSNIYEFQGEGVITRNYNPNNLIEVTGFEILMYNARKNNVIQCENTLENYELSLKLFKQQNPKIKVDIDNIMLSLKKLFMLDYFCCQSDRNWYNIEFLLDAKTLTLAPIFDSGCIFYWNNRESVLQHQYKSLSNKFNYRVLNELTRSKSMALGIKTPTSMQDQKDPTRTTKLKLSQEIIDTVEDELVEMIAQSKELQDFLFENFDFEEKNLLKNAFQMAYDEYGKETFNPLLENQSQLMYTLRCKKICGLVREKLAEEENAI